MSAGACVGGAPKNVRDRMAHRRRDTDRSWKPAPSVDPVRAGTCFITTPTGMPCPPRLEIRAGPRGQRGGVPSCSEGEKIHGCVIHWGFQTKVRSLRFAMLAIVGNIGVGAENFSRGGLRRKGLV